jgi:hypothetical protein
LILADDPEALLAPVIPVQSDSHSERCLTLVRGWLENFRARTPRPPVTHFPQGDRGGVLVAFIGGCPVLRLVTAERSLDCGKPASVTKLW